MDKIISSIVKFDWKEAAPRWFMVFLIAIQFMGIGYLYNEVGHLRVDKEALQLKLIEKLQQEVKDNTVERIVVLEADRRNIWQALERQSKASEELAAQVKILNKRLK